MKTLQDITDSDTYKQILADSFGGIMYDVSNKDKYDSTEILQAWNNLTGAEQEQANGIVKGAIDFLQGAM